MIQGNSIFYVFENGTQVTVGVDNFFIPNASPVAFPLILKNVKVLLNPCVPEHYHF